MSLPSRAGDVVIPAPPQRKSERTRARILAAALELFADEGYDGTTVAQIAAAAAVTEMTFYRHFGSKDQLLIDDPYDPLIAAAIGEQPIELGPLVRTARGIRAAWRQLPISAEAPVRERIRIVAASPTLLTAMRGGSAATEAAIAERLVADGTAEIEAAIAAAAAMAALNTGLLRWATATQGSLGDAIERSLDVLEGRHA